MSNLVKLPCGCEYAIELNREVWTQLCIQHKKEFDMRHATAAEYCSHISRNPNLDLISGAHYHAAVARADDYEKDHREVDAEHDKLLARFRAFYTTANTGSTDSGEVAK